MGKQIAAHENKGQQVLKCHLHKHNDLWRHANTVKVEGQRFFLQFFLHKFKKNNSHVELCNLICAPFAYAHGYRVQQFILPCHPHVRQYTAFKSIWAYTLGFLFKHMDCLKKYVSSNQATKYL